jgi:hypothetical protein
MSGTDLILPSFLEADLSPSRLELVDPIKIPTTILNLEENNIPDKLLQIYLNNYRMTSASNSDPSEKSLLVVEETIEENDEAEAINLSTVFGPTENLSYQYNIDELKDIVKSPPTYVKITKVPAYGKIAV